MIFCFGEGENKSKGDGYQKNHMAWNKSISASRYSELLKEVNRILGRWEPNWKGSTREKEWSKVRASQWKKLSEIPEFDIEITKKITGLDNILDESTVEITCEGKPVSISRESAKALNLI